MEPTIQKKTFLDPPKHQFYRGKTMGYGKTFFPQKTKRVFLVRLFDEAGYPETLYFTLFFEDLTRFVFEPQKWQDSPDDGSRWPQVPPSWLQIVQIIHTQSHTH